LAAGFSLLCCAMLTGCGRSEAEFRLDLIEAKKCKVSPQQQQQIADILRAMFGTPDDPFVLPQTGLDLQKIQIASGPVHRDAESGPRGLFREHCMHCHGINGDGAGPTAAFLNPYPRDYRRGWFKFKSTRREDEPTTENLLRIVTGGIQGTAMPAFRLYPDVDRLALVEYVKYLSMRGQMELALDRWVANNTTKPTDAVPSDPNSLLNLLGPIAEQWKEPVQVAVDDRPEDMKFDKITDVIARQRAEDRSIAIGRAMFLNEKPGEMKYGSETIKYMGAGCFKCHGPTQLGDGQTTDYDDWTKEVWDKVTWKYGVSLTDKPPDHPLPSGHTPPVLESELPSLGALPERHIIPRNLRLGVYHGGRRPLDIYYRVHEGIKGAPMPANTDSLLTAEEKTQLQKVMADANAKAKKIPELQPDDDDTDEQAAIKRHKKEAYIAKIVDPVREKILAPRIWHLVDFVLSLPYQPGGEMGVDYSLPDTAAINLPSR
jgi:mono/diheme cytochrome c family protein